jgi:2-isopropylmalate synthase
MGLATANAVAGVLAGATYVSTTVNGIGELAGNCPHEEGVMTMRTRCDRFPYETAIVSEQIFSASQMLARIITFGPQPNCAGFSSISFTRAMNFAAKRPSMTRWSALSVTVRTFPGRIAPQLTTTSSRTAPTARMLASGGLIIAANSSTPTVS